MSMGDGEIHAGFLTRGVVRGWTGEGVSFMQSRHRPSGMTNYNFIIILNEIWMHR